MEPHPNPRLAAGVGVILVLALAVGAFWLYRAQQEAAENATIESTPTTTADTATPTPSPTVSATPSSTASAAVTASPVAKKTFSLSATLEEVAYNYSYQYPSDWTAKKATEVDAGHDIRASVLSHTYEGKEYKLWFAWYGREYYEYEMTVKDIKLGGKTYEQKLFRKPGANSVIWYHEKADANEKMPYVLADIPADLEDELLPLYEAVIATLK